MPGILVQLPQLLSAEVVLCTHNTTTSASLDYCHKFFNPYLHQFSSISGGNCINEPGNEYQKIKVHLGFHTKHVRRHYARLIADCHLTKEPMETVYSGVVSHRSLRLGVFLAELNQLGLLGADIGNVYLEAKTKE